MNDRKQPNDFLDEMCSIWMARKLHKVLLYALTHQLVLLIVGEELYQGLNSMSPLFIPNDVCDVLVQTLHYFESLSIVAYAEQFLHHVVRILVSDKLGQLHVQSLDN